MKGATGAAGQTVWQLCPLRAGVNAVKHYDHTEQGGEL